MFRGQTVSELHWKHKTSPANTASTKETKKKKKKKAGIFLALVQF